MKTTTHPDIELAVLIGAEVWGVTFRNRVGPARVDHQAKRIVIDHIAPAGYTLGDIINRIGAEQQQVSGGRFATT